MKAEWRVAAKKTSYGWSKKRSKQHIWIKNHDKSRWDYTWCQLLLGDMSDTVDPLPTDAKCKHCLNIEAKGEK